MFHAHTMPQGVVCALFLLFKWQDVYDSGLEIHARLDCECYVGSVTLPILEGSRVCGIKLISHGRTVGVYSVGTGRTEAVHRHTGYIGTWFSDPVFEGKSENGEDILVLGQVVENPHPDKILETIIYKSAENDISKVILCRVEGLKKCSKFCKTSLV